MAKCKAIRYSRSELAWIEANCTLARKAPHQAFCMTFGRGDVSLEHYNALCKRKGWQTGRDGRMTKGSIPWNKGKECPEGEGGKHPNARRTQFKPGVRHGVAVKLYKPIGTERLSKEGYLERKIHDGMPLQSRWRAIHLIRWEEVNGNLPRGMCLKCLDGNRRNTDPDNWAAIPRGAIPFLNGHRGYDYDRMPDELKPAMLVLAKVKHARSKAAKRMIGQRAGK